MTLTSEQIAAVSLGQPVTVEIDGKACVVVLKEIYEKDSTMIDFSEMHPDEAYEAIELAWGDDPGLDAYQDLK